VDLHIFVGSWLPFVSFSVRSVLSIEQAIKGTKAMPV